MKNPIKIKFIVILILFSTFTFSQVDSLNYYYQKGDYQKAIEFGEYVIEYYENNKIEKDYGYIVSVSWLVHLTDKIKDSSKKAKYIHVLDENINLFGNNNEFLINHYFILGEYYNEVENYDLAVEKYLKCLKIVEETHKLDENYFYYLQRLGEIYILKKEQFFFKENALGIFKKQASVSLELFGKNSNEYAFSLNNLGFFFDFTDKRIEAESYFLQSYSIIENFKGNSNNNYLAILDNISKFYQKSNNLSKADFYNEIGLQLIINNKYDNNEYLSFLSNKALIKTELGDYDYALKLYDECLKLAREIYGIDSSFYGTMISNVASIYYIKKEFLIAEKLFNIDYNITLKKYGENHFQTAMSLNRLSNIYSSLKQDQKAIDYNLKALKILDNTLGTENNNYATVCSSLGTQYSLVNDEKNALKYYVKSYNIKLKLNGKYSSSNLIILNNLITQNANIQNTNEQIKFLSEYFELLKYNLIQMNSNFGELDLLKYINKIVPNNSYLSFLNYRTQYPEINIDCYENELLLKNLSLRNQKRIKNNILKSNDTVLKQQYEQFIANKRYLTKLEELPIVQRPQTYEQLKTDTESLEKDITRKSSDFAEAKKSLNITWKQIQEKLKPNEVVIDLVSYNYYNKKWTDSIMYGAFVIKKDSKFPKFISLFEEKQLTALLAKGTNQAEAINKQYSNLEISNLFLKPLEAELKNVKTIYLTPTGVAHQINFKALPLQNNNTLGESYDVKLMGSSAQIIAYKPTSIQENKNMELVLYGGIDYDKKTTETDIASNPNDFNDLATRSGIVEFGYLKGTNLEIEKIKELATQNNYTTLLLKERNATEESIKKLDSKTNPFILHLATHGYFFENIKREKTENSGIIKEMPKHNFYKESEDPMLRSGLIFAGANKFWKNTNKEIAGDDGIVTAKEIANLDLSNCQLVVLSACETGLGDVNGSEGVFGLQRAFKMAGVKSIIMSLWKVPDAQTAELFEVFYAECFKGKTIPEAFREAQNKMKTKYDPFYWAGFVLLE
jgi:CHAT domain-containing protein